jgi:hypothetical protein
MPELIQTGVEILRSEIHKLVHSIWNRKEFPQQWAESIIVPISKNPDKTDCSNQQVILLLSTKVNVKLSL